jgi:hypothetical protein
MRVSKFWGVLYRKLTIGLCNQVRERIASKVDGGEAIFCIDSMPI